MQCRPRRTATTPMAHIYLHIVGSWGICGDTMAFCWRGQLSLLFWMSFLTFRFEKSPGKPRCFLFISCLLLEVAAWALTNYTSHWWSDRLLFSSVWNFENLPFKCGYKFLFCDEGVIGCWGCYQQTCWLIITSALDDISIQWFKSTWWSVKHAS